MINDRINTVLEQYDIRVLRLLKGRGATLCETENGIKILKEYKGSSGKIDFQDRLLKEIKKNGGKNIEQILPSKEGELLVKEEEGVFYYLKDYPGGKECNIRESKDCMLAMYSLGNLHKAMELKELVHKKEIPVYDIIGELEKQNRELKKIKKYLKEKKQKTQFEFFLQANFNPFLEKAEQVVEEMKNKKEFFRSGEILEKGYFCHGDLQHHNLFLLNEEVFFINFEKFVLDLPVRDLVLFFRKMMEKNNWSEEMGNQVLKAYETVRPLSAMERTQFYYRLYYPEKFRKIANFYYNSPKAWIPDKNREKLEKILEQETKRIAYLEKNSYLRE